jgi:methionyl-tRNA formyltransferase
MLETVYFGNNVDYLEVLHACSRVRLVFAQTTDHASRTGRMVEFAQACGIEVHRPENMQAVRPILDGWRPDLIVVGSYDKLVPAAVFTRAAKGAINIHPSLLPRYRGQHVINWVLVNGESQTGVTIHYLDERFDTGDIIVQQPVEIRHEDDACTLTEKLSAVGASLLRELVDRFERGAVSAQPQDHSRSTRVRSRTPEDGRIDLQKSAPEIRNLVRALVRPWPGAFCDVVNADGSRGRLTCYRCDIIENANLPALKRGEIFSVDDGISVHLDGGSGLRLVDYHVDGAGVAPGSVLR